MSFQTWDWEGEHYRLTQYIIEDEGSLQLSRFECEYRASRRAERRRCRRMGYTGRGLVAFCEPFL